MYLINFNSEKSRKRLFYWFKKSHIDRILPDGLFGVVNYYLRMGRTLNYKSPKTFDEKLWYLNIFENSESKCRCTDKLAVREYVASKGLEEILTKVFGIWDKACDINFNSLPDICYLKCNHLSGGNHIYRKNSSNIVKIKKQLNKNLKRNYYKGSRERNYKDIKSKIFAEEYLSNTDGSALVDYKFYCFNGVPKMLIVSNGVADYNGEHARAPYENFYDEFLQPINVYDGCPKLPESQIVFPDNCGELFRVASILSAPFKFVRVDLYSIDNKVYFGELTFCPAAALHNYEPNEFNLQLGDLLKL